MIGGIAGALAYVLRLYSSGQRLSPDGVRYLAMAKGERQPSPYHRRWLLPALLGARERAWRAASVISLVACVTLLTIWIGGPWPRQLAAAVLFVGLPIFRVNVHFPILVDATAMALALGAAVTWQHGHHEVAIGLALVAGAVKESAPLFAALYAGAPWLLVGVAAARWWGAASADADPYSGSPSRVAKRIWFEGRHDFFRWDTMLLPWGALVVLGPLGAGRDTLTALTAAALAIGYAQLFFAVDRARLYQWAAPLVIALAMRAPDEALVVGCVLHWGNPSREI